MRNLTRFDNKEPDDVIWALRDIDLDVGQGEVIGIIGANGAGKSTLLKILSRITEPSAGSVEIHGRVSSLLEVGTGFHPELTGRENVYLNGTILGMRKKEIDRKFDEIVEFSGVGKFIDTPVKRFSSGMQMRLAFSVAAHLEPEILIVDEVLAVGDIAFQKKCLGKMDEVAHEGRTVLFVSHNMATIKALCGRAVLLSEGKISAQGEVLSTVAAYLNSISVDSAVAEISIKAHADSSKIRLNKARLINPFSDSFTVLWNQPIELLLDIEVLEPVENACFGLGVVSIEGTPIFTVHHDDIQTESWSFNPGRYNIKVRIENTLRAGHYWLAAGAHETPAKTSLFHVPQAVKFEVLDVPSLDSATEYISHNTGLVNGVSFWEAPERVLPRSEVK